MKRRVFIALATGCVGWGLSDGVAVAQTGQLGTYNPPQVRQRGPVSPYINMGPGGNAADYYGIVRPQIDAMKAFDQLQYGLAHVADGTTPLNSVLPQNMQNSLGGLQTGHPVSFNNYQRFFPLTAGTVTGMPGTPGYGVPGYGQTGFGQAGYGQAGYGQAGFGTPGAGLIGAGQGGGAGRMFFPGTMGPGVLR